jgi:hypothetical protein
VRRAWATLGWGRPARVYGRWATTAWKWWWSGSKTVLVACLRGCYLRDREVVAKLDEVERMAMQKPSSEQAAKAGTSPHADGGTWAEAYPRLTEWLVEPAWDDGSSKAPAKVFLSAQRGRWLWTLKAVGLGLILEVEVEDPAEGPAALEAALGAKTIPWRVDPWEQAKRKGKGSK